MAAPTLEDFMGIGDFPQDFPPPAGEWQLDGGSSGGSGAVSHTYAAPDNQDTSGGGGDQAPIDPAPAPPPEDGGHVAHRGRPTLGGQQGGDEPAPPAPPTPPAPPPTPPDRDYSQLNALLAQLLAGQNSRSQADMDYRNNVKQTVLSLIKSGSAPVDPNDPTITSATQAFRGEGERALALLREKQAEASRAGGRTAGSEESAMKGGYEDLGNATGSYRANLQIQELNARRQQLMQAASIGAGVSNADDANALQSQIAAIDGQIKELSLKSNANLTQQGITNQNTQFYDNLASNMGNQKNTLDELLSQYLLNAA